MKTAFIFPGQGSQKVGMGKELADSFPRAMAVFEDADRVLGTRLSSLCFEGPEEELMLTTVTQPAILATSIAVLRVAQSTGLKPDFVAGHSLGEYSALVAAGSLEFAQAVRLEIIFVTPPEVLLSPGQTQQMRGCGDHKRQPRCSATMPPVIGSNATRPKPAVRSIAANASGRGKRRIDSTR